jgi:hypothetical protein
MKMLFKAFVKALENYVESSDSFASRFMSVRDLMIKTEKVKLAGQLQDFINNLVSKQEIQDEDLISSLSTIKEASTLAAGIAPRAPGHFEALLNWMSGCVRDAQKQRNKSMPENMYPLSPKQKIIKNDLDDFIVYAKGFSSIPRNYAFLGSLYPQETLYPYKNNWDSKRLTINKLDSIAQRVEELQKNAIRSINHANEVQENTMLGPFLNNLKAIDPVLKPLITALEEALDITYCDMESIVTINDGDWEEVQDLSSIEPQSVSNIEENSEDSKEAVEVSQEVNAVTNAQDPSSVPNIEEDEDIKEAAENTDELTRSCKKQQMTFGLDLLHVTRTSAYANLSTCTEIGDAKKCKTEVNKKSKKKGGV